MNEQIKEYLEKYPSEIKQEIPENILKQIFVETLG